ncbi:hypothetical protein [Mucilaginibacter lappiensis]|uniref:hypothetical protein n=1 Tax=Mucilaginibacter lappiensis TaxID=354630 RepID=UPI00158D725F|nr:hypothetical protein [Mucilaginibacter lappiensis]
MKPTDDEIVRLIRSQSKDGVEELFDAYATFLLLVIIRIVPQKDKAEIVLERTFQKIWNSIDQYPLHHQSFLAWMRVLARDLANEAALNKNSITTAEND